MSNKIYISIAILLFVLMPLSIIKAIWMATFGRFFNREDQLNKDSYEQGQLSY